MTFIFNKNLMNLPFFLGGMLFAATSCSTAQKASTIGEISPEEKEQIREEATKLKGKTSSIEIEYVLGRSHYRLYFHSIEEAAKGQNLVDKQIISKSSIQYASYLEYLSKTLFFVKQNQRMSEPQRLEMKTENCRAPFKITIHVAEEISTAKGCRNRDNGALSKLVQQGEFLLYSKN